MATPYTKTFGCATALFVSLAFFSGAWFVARKAVVSALGLSGTFGAFAILAAFLWLVAKAAEWKKRSADAKPPALAGRTNVYAMQNCAECGVSEPTYFCFPDAVVLCLTHALVHQTRGCRVASYFNPPPVAQAPGPVAVSSPGDPRG